jgi:uncharacterized protein YegP (UPF0339 family)
MSRSKTKQKPGIHLLVTHGFKIGKDKFKKEYYWHIVSRNGRVIARSSETYTRKGNAVKSIKVAAFIFLKGDPYALNPLITYYDHSKPYSPLQSYL